MRRDRRIKMFIVIGLVLATLGMAIGFAAYSNTLTISSELAVKPDSGAFDIKLSSTDTKLTEGEVEPTINAKTTYSGITSYGVSASNAVIDNSSIPTISNFKVSLTEPGDEVVYEFYVYNSGEYTAYLNNILFNNVDGASSPKVCSPKEGSDIAKVSAACDDITLSLKVGSEAPISATTINMNGHALNSKAFEKVTLTISYTGSYDVGGDFRVVFGDISLYYSTVSNGADVPEGTFPSGGGSSGTTNTKLCTYQGTDETQKYAYGAEYSCTLADGTPRTFYVLEDGDDTELSKGTTGSAGTGELALIMDRNFTDATVPSTLAWCIDGGDDYTTCQSINSKEEGTPLKHIQDTFGSDVTASFATYEQIESANGGNTSSLPQWLYDYLEETTHPVSGVYGYWTASPFTNNTSLAWHVSFDGTVYDGSVGDSVSLGVRPVITISKDNLEGSGNGSTTGGTTTVYRCSTDTISIGDTINTSSYTTDPTTLGKDYYLKHVLDSDNKVTESYACAVFNGKETCVRGGSPDYYAENMLILQGLQDEGLSCDLGDHINYCYGGYIGLHVDSYGRVDSTGGSVDAFDYYDSCYVDSDGSSSCVS